jgi:HAD superfamily hydrolase (TIGR01549 family)
MDRLSPKAVIFDLGSTLIEYETLSWNELSELCAASAREFLLKEGFNVPAEAEFYEAFEKVKDTYRRVAFEKYIEWTIPQAAARLFNEIDINFNMSQIDRFFNAYYEPVDKRLYVYDDTIATLVKVRQRYEVIGLISNTIFPERVHRRELQRFGIEPFLDFALFSSTFKLRKPHPDIFHKAANLAGYAPAECVYIGDRYEEDVRGPQSAGMSAILKVHDSRQYPDSLLQDTRCIRSLSELDSHLDF